MAPASAAPARVGVVAPKSRQGDRGDSEPDEEVPSGRWLRTRAAARHLGIGFSTLNKLRLTGGGPKFAKLGSVVIYDRSDLDAWATARKIASTSERVRAA